MSDPSLFRRTSSAVSPAVGCPPSHVPSFAKTASWLGHRNPLAATSTMLPRCGHTNESARNCVVPTRSTRTGADVPETTTVRPPIDASSGTVAGSRRNGDGTASSTCPGALMMPSPQPDTSTPSDSTEAEARN
jgi:hypothetical protein